MFLVETGRETEISELDVTTSVEQDVVRLDITKALSAVCRLEGLAAIIPMDETELVYRFQS